MSIFTESIEELFYANMYNEFLMMEPHLTKISDRLEGVELLVDSTSVVWTDSTALYSLLTNTAETAKNILPDFMEPEQKTPELQAKYDQYLEEFQYTLARNKLFRFRIYMTLLELSGVIREIPDNVPEYVWPYIQFSGFEETLENITTFPPAFMHALKPYLMQKVKAEVDSMMSGSPEIEIAVQLYDIQQRANTTISKDMPVLAAKTDSYIKAGLMDSTSFEDRITLFVNFLPFDEKYRLDIDKVIEDYNVTDEVKKNIRLCFSMAAQLTQRFDVLTRMF